MIFEINRVNAYRKENGNWTWDSAVPSGTFRTRAYDVRRAIKRVLSGMGMWPGKERLCVSSDGSRYEVSVIVTGEPLYTVTRVG